MFFNPNDALQLFLFVLTINVLVSAISLVIALELSKGKRPPLGVLGYALLPVGLIALLSSIFLESSVLAFIGLGLTFWGALILYVRPGRLVTVSLLDSTAFPSLVAVEQLMDEFGVEGRAIYLPPRNTEELRGGKILILKTKDETIVPKAHEAILTGDPSGLFITPPGVALTNLYEDKLGKEFFEIGLDYIRENIPKLFIEDLEIAENLEMTVEDSLITVNIEGTPYSNLCMEVRKLTRINNSVGCPFCSSIAIVIARSTGRPLIFEGERVSEEGKNIEIKYRIL